MGVKKFFTLSAVVVGAVLQGTGVQEVAASTTVADYEEVLEESREEGYDVRLLADCTDEIIEEANERAFKEIEEAQQIRLTYVKTKKNGYYEVTVMDEHGSGRKVEMDSAEYDNLVARAQDTINQHIRTVEQERIQELKDEFTEEGLMKYGYNEKTGRTEYEEVQHRVRNRVQYKHANQVLAPAIEGVEIVPDVEPEPEPEPEPEGDLEV